MADETQVSGRFGTSLAQELAKHRMTLRDLSNKTGASYEHCRKLLRGLTFPSRLLLKEICRVVPTLKLEEAEKVVVADKMEHKYGKNAYRAFGHDPRLAQYEQVVPHLTKEQHEQFLAQMKAVARMNRQRKA
jgi:hypothetical protein